MKLSKTQILIISAFMLSLLSVAFMLGHISKETQMNKNTAYDYCVEWNGYIQRSNLIYNCYELTTGNFTCDYKVLNDGRLRIKPIENSTRNSNGKFESIEYGNSTYYNCSRWVKTKYVPEHDVGRRVKISK